MNNYCIGGGIARLAREQVETAREIVDQVCHELETEDETIGFDTMFTKDDELVIYSDECLNLEHAERLARRLVEEVNLGSPFEASWAYTCDRGMCVENFGGGAFVAARGLPTIWVDALAEARWKLNELIETRKNSGLIDVAAVQVNDGSHN
jgi:hypothetical protein